MTETEPAKPFWRRLSTAVGVCAALLVASFLFNSFIIRIDVAAAKHLNSLVGHAPTLDHVVRLIADKDGREYLILALMVSLVIYVLMSSSRSQRSTRVATILFISTVVLLAMIVEHRVEDIIE